MLQPSRRGARPVPRLEREPDPIDLNPRISDELLRRMAESHPGRSGMSATSRRLLLERSAYWMEAAAITVARAGYRLEWRMCPMPVRYAPCDNGAAFRLHNYLSEKGWIPLGQLWGCPPPTDTPLANPDYVYPPYSADLDFARWFLRATSYWREVSAIDDGAILRRLLHLRRRGILPRPLGECVLFVQDNVSLRSVPAVYLAWVQDGRMPSSPVDLRPVERLPSSLHPAGVHGDMLYSPRGAHDIDPPPYFDIGLLDVRPDVALPPSFARARPSASATENPGSPLEEAAREALELYQSLSPAAQEVLTAVQGAPASGQIEDTSAAAPPAEPQGDNTQQTKPDQPSLPQASPPPPSSSGKKSKRSSPRTTEKGSGSKRPRRKYRRCVYDGEEALDLGDGYIVVPLSRAPPRGSRSSYILLPNDDSSDGEPVPFRPGDPNPLGLRIARVVAVPDSGQTRAPASSQPSSSLPADSVPEGKLHSSLSRVLR